MKFLDLLVMSFGNLRRRKLRTMLTVLGVLIGTASVVIMVSIGIGLDELTTEAFEQYGSLTAIEVYSSARWGGETGGKSEPLYIKDETIETFKGLEHVKSVSPILTTNIILRQGVWECNAEITGVNREYMEQMKFGQGGLPAEGSRELELIIGNTILQRFSNSRTGKGYYDGIIPDVDYFKPMFTILDTDAYYQSRSGTSENPVKAPKKYLFKTAGVIAGGPEDWNQYSYSIYTDIDALKAQLKKVYKNKPIPNQPTNKKGKPYKYFIYDKAVVYVDDMKNVTGVQKLIVDMGFEASSNTEWLEQSKQQSRMIQAVLGTIGAVSLFVAAIGIANTMMMSIYERTKEIGIMKVLGCDMKKIRDMFLIESAMIGLLGGVAGIFLSYIVSFAINKFGIGLTLTGMPGDISRLPLWLPLIGMGFSVIVSMFAGFFPSLRAMKLSPLAALRNE